MFLRKGVLKIYCKFTAEHPCRSAISIKLLSKFIEIALRHGCSPVNLLHIFRTPFSRNTSGWLLLIIENERLEAFENSWDLRVKQVSIKAVLRKLSKSLKKLEHSLLKSLQSHQILTIKKTFPASLPRNCINNFQKIILFTIQEFVKLEDDTVLNFNIARYRVDR